MRTLELFALGALAACTAAGAQAPAPAKPAANAAVATIAEFQWLAGHWCLEKGDELVEETWMAPRGGLMLGMGRTLRGGQVGNFEFLSIELQDGVATFVARPNGTSSTPFRLTASGETWARFENPQHDFPKRVEYRRTSKTRLQAQIAGPGKHGAEQIIAFDYIACPAR